MTTLRTAAQQALEALEMAEFDPHSSDAVHKAITALRAALAEPVQEPTLDEVMAGPRALAQAYENGRNAAKAEPAQEPVAWRFQSAVGGWAYGSQPPLGSKYPAYPLYAAPPQRKPLTEEDIQAAWDSVDMRHPRGNETRIAFARAIERAHGITS